MEILLLVIAVAAVWLVFMPRRTARKFGQLPMIMKPAVVGAILLAGWAVLQSWNPPPAETPVNVAAVETPSEAGADYASADSELRALLE